MFPYINDYFYKIDIANYGILLVIGILIATLCFRIFATKTKMDSGAYNFYLFIGILSIGAGLFSAFLFQAIYNYAETGDFELRGMTVMGGILGAAIFFIVSVLILVNTKLGRKYKPDFWTAVNLIVPCIVIAQCFGRLGCFMAGCCYGKETSGPLGVVFVREFTPNGTPISRLPTQLFESIFMLLLFIAMVLIMFKFKKKHITALLYLYTYPIFRFFIEFLRDDYRGAWLLGMSPSQIQSIGFLSVGILLTVLIYGFKIIPFGGKRKENQAIPYETTVEQITTSTIKADADTEEK